MAPRRQDRVDSRAAVRDFWTVHLSDQFLLSDLTEPVASKLDQQAIERDHQHLKGLYRPMRGFKQPRCAQIVCAGHGFMRNLGDGFYRLGFVWRGPTLPHPPRLLTAWGELTECLQAA
jgi:hypothetical protein